MSLGPWIAGLTSRRTRYIEPFAGMCGVLMCREPVPFELINDLDQRIVTWWKVVRERPDELKHYLHNTPYSRAVYDRSKSIVRSGEPVDELTMAHAVAVVLTQSRIPSLPGTGWRVTGRGAGSHPDATSRQIHALADRMRRVKLECRDAQTIADYWAGKDDTTIYLDPPYRGLGEYAVDTDLGALADIVRHAKADVAISGYASCGWDDLLPDYERREMATHHVGAGGWRTECVWVNYDPPDRLL